MLLKYIDEQAISMKMQTKTRGRKKARKEVKKGS